MSITGLDESLELLVKQTFLMEADELLASAEEGFLALERDPTDGEVIARIFRVAHTFKGSALSVGFQGIGRFAHWLEAVLDLVRQGQAKVDPEIMNALLRGLDHLKAEVGLLRKDVGSGKLREEDAAFLKRLFEELSSGRRSVRASESADGSARAGGSDDATGADGFKASSTVIHGDRMRNFGPTRDELADAAGSLASLSRVAEPIAVQRRIGDEHAPIYEHFSIQKVFVPVDSQEVEFYSRINFEHERRLLAADHYGPFAQLVLDALRSHPRFQNVGRACVVRWVGYTRRLEVVDSACVPGRVPNTMPRGYGCFLRNESSLLQLDAEHYRSFVDSARILMSFRDHGAPPQRSIRRLHLAGLRSGIALPLRASGRIGGFLFLNGTEPRDFQGLTFAEAQALLFLRTLAECFLQQEARLPDSHYRSYFLSQGTEEGSLPHSVFDADRMAGALVGALERFFAKPPRVSVDAPKGFRFLQSDEHCAYAIARLVQAHAGLWLPGDSLSVRVEQEALKIRFRVDGLGDASSQMVCCAEALEPVRTLAEMCGFAHALTPHGFTLTMECDESEGGLDYSC
jgi:HPt (histidine-containing phosphotransfer) domain-containing protein